MGDTAVDRLGGRQRNRPQRCVVRSGQQRLGLVVDRARRRSRWRSVQLRPLRCADMGRGLRPRWLGQRGVSRLCRHLPCLLLSASRCKQRRTPVDRHAQRSGTDRAQQFDPADGRRGDDGRRAHRPARQACISARGGSPTRQVPQCAGPERLSRCGHDEHSIARRRREFLGGPATRRVLAHEPAGVRRRRGRPGQVRRPSSVHLCA